MSISQTRVPDDAVYVYRSAGKTLEFRRPDHRAPSGMDVRDLVAIVWATGADTRVVAMPGATLTATDVAHAFLWRGQNPLPVEPPAGLFPFQQSAFQELVRHNVATLLCSLGTGGFRVVAAAAYHQAAQLGTDKVHVLAGRVTSEQLAAEFEEISRHAGTHVTAVRVTDPGDFDDTSAQVALVVPSGLTPAASKRDGYFQDRANALAALAARGGVIYMSDNRELPGIGMRVVQGLVSKRPEPSPFSGELYSAMRLLCDGPDGPTARSRVKATA